MARARTDPKIDPTSELRERVDKLEAELTELRALIAKDIAAIHRSLKSYKESNDSTIGEIRQVTESLVRSTRRRG